MVAFSTRASYEITYIELIVFVIAASILAALWQRAFENLMFVTLGYSRTSSWVHLVVSVAVAIVVILIVVTYPVTKTGFREGGG